MTDEPNFQPVVPDLENHVEPPARASFKEGKLAGEPASDRKLILESGMALRERVTVADARADGVVTSADPAAIAFTIQVSHALLDSKGKVALVDGKPVIAPAHEITLTHEALGRLGTEKAVQDAIKDAREVAAARAEMVFTGTQLAGNLLPGRI